MSRRKARYAPRLFFVDKRDDAKHVETNKGLIQLNLQNLPVIISVNHVLLPEADYTRFLI